MKTTIAVMAPKDTDRTGTSDVAERLRLTRAALGLTQAAISRLVGIGAQAWNNNEAGRYRISLDQAVKLCIATGVSLDWIFRGDMRGLPHDLAVKIQKLSSEESSTRRRA